MPTPPPDPSRITELTARGLGKRFGRRVIFRRLDMTARGGRVLAVTGHNGSGKSTLIRILAGVMRASAGEVFLTAEGAEVPPEDRPFMTGLVAPYLDVYDRFSPVENLGFIARARSMPDAAERITAVLERVELLDRMDDLVATFSSGMKQRMRFAAALLSDPPVLLLDEPTSNLDQRGKDVVHGIIRGVSDEGRVVVVATNDAAEAAACDDEVSVTDFPPRA